MAGAAPVGIYPSAISYPIVWDQFQVGPLSGPRVTWQGKIEVRSAVLKYRWDIKTPPGADGEVQTYRGKATRPLRVTFYLWTDTHFNTWPQYSLLFQYPGSKIGLVNPVSVYHPALAMIGITTVTCEELGAVEHVGDLLFRAVVTLRQYIPPPPLNTTSTPAGPAVPATATAPGYVPNPAIAALEARIEALQQQASQLGTPGGLPL